MFGMLLVKSMGVQVPESDVEFGLNHRADTILDKGRKYHFIDDPHFYEYDFLRLSKQTYSKQIDVDKTRIDYG